MTDSSSSTPRSALGDLLRARRADLTPEDVGLPETGAVRRVPGLRREEVALLAAISTDYYMRLEQGRMSASGSVLDSLARALRLSAEERDYLRDLHEAGATQHRRRSRNPQPAMVRVLEDLAHTPAVVMGRRMEIIAWNRLACTLILDFAELSGFRRSYVHMVFRAPEFRRLYGDGWSEMAQTCVAILRREAALHPGDREMRDLVGELSLRDEDFRRWWGAHRVAERRRGTKRLHHPVVGDLDLDWDVMTSADDPEQQLITWTAAPGSSAQAKLRDLALRAEPRGQAP